MRKWLFPRRVLPALGAISTLFAGSIYAQLSTTFFDRAQADVVRIRALVEQGTLPPASLQQAEERLADAQDQLTLSETLYSETKLQELTSEHAAAMVTAASRRVDRAQALVDDRRKLLDMGIISRSEFDAVKNEVYARQLVLDLARNRARLLDELHQMALEEQRLQPATLKQSLIRYDGTAPFTLANLAGIEQDFKTQFHRDLPVSAIGQTLVHQGLGLDHRNKVDVALNPELPEGLWLRHYLEKRHMPYLAFRSAVAGAATGAHIHIGPGSSRLTSAHPS